MKTIHAMIRGRVQGVWYRGWTVEQATRRGLAGWVRNRADGSVEAIFSGPADVIDDMLAACRRGPPAAAVTGVDTSETQEGVGPGFHQRPTV